MTHSVTRRKLLAQWIGGGFASLGLSAIGCGSILYPERVGQPRGAIDWKVAALDTAGLVLFFIPGLIAFAVDFYNGTIYLPRGGYSQHRPVITTPKWESVRVPEGSLNQAGIEHVVSKQLGQSVELDAHRCHSERLDDLQQFWPRARALQEQTPA